MKRTPAILMLLLPLIAACNQPFEPVGPVDNKLVVFGVLNSATDTQYVRIATTFGASGTGDVRDAAVQLSGNGQVFAFRDTTVLWRDTVGNLVPTGVYVAYHAPLLGGAQYLLQASTPSGRSASATIDAVTPPLFSLQPYSKPGYFTLNVHYNTLSGAAVIHFYLDYYVLINNGWQLRTEEVPRQISSDGSGAFIYPALAPVVGLASAGPTVLIDSAYFWATRAKVFSENKNTQVVLLDIRFTLTHIDQSLYDYYYITNGPVDRSSVRLDVLDFTNVRGGYGVCGSRAEVDLIFSLVR